MLNNYILFKKQRDLGAIISDTFKFIRQEYKTIFRLYLKHVGWLLLLAVATSTYYQYTSLNSANSLLESGAEAFLLNAFQNTGLSLILVFLAFVAYTTMSLTAVNSIIKSYVDNKGEIKDEEVSLNIRRFFGQTLLSLFVFGILCFIGLLLCFLPGVYLAVPLSLIFSIVVFQEKSFSDAFSECFQLVKQNWWITFVTVLVISLLVSLIGGVFQLPIIVLTAVEAFTSLNEGGDTAGVLGLGNNWIYLSLYVFASIAQYILGLITLISLALIYFNLNEIRNKTGTLEDIDGIGD
jgi:4-hydroxybenzoate polyprenyltransferase